MILCIDLSYKMDSLGWHEFVAPIMEIIRKQGIACDSIHYSEFAAGGRVRAEGLIMCGTALCDNLFSQNKESFQWLHACECPVLGVCAGCQALLQAFGALLEVSPEIGTKSIRSVRENDFITCKQFDAYELHRYAPGPSDQFIVLAESDSCIQAVKHRSLPYYGVMFHPEVRNEWVVDNFLSICNGHKHHPS